MDCIRINDLVVFANHGVLEEETRLGQKFLLSVSLFLDAREAAASGDLSQTVNYAKVCEKLTEWMKQETCLLIESVADTMAQKLLVTYPILEQVELTVKKPWAPIGLVLDTVSVTVKRGWHQVFLGIGSNLGDMEANILEAVRLLEADEMIQVKCVSSLIETEPVGGVVQPNFLNGAVAIRTLYSPEQLLEQIGQIEAALGRERIVHWGPRTIDLDILLYDDEVIRTERLYVPHIEMEHRGFVLEPLCEIAPAAIHPLKQATVYQLYQEWLENN